MVQVAVLSVIAFWVRTRSFVPVQIRLGLPLTEASLKVTLPVGWVVAAGPVTVAVKTSDVP